LQGAAELYSLYCKTIIPAVSVTKYTLPGSVLEFHVMATDAETDS